MAEYTRFGWTVMSPGVETNLDNMFLAQTVHSVGFPKILFNMNTRKGLFPLAVRQIYRSIF